MVRQAAWWWARLLTLGGYETDVCILENFQTSTKEMEKQIEIGRNYGISFVKTFCVHEYTTIVYTALFGVGLSREIKGTYRETIESLEHFRGKLLMIFLPVSMLGQGQFWVVP